ncbi:MAG: (d)CMP kinase [Thermoguttaceae bacterium]|nr:(d)CMP kinase [Thermoguttaceae bacterium]
MSIDVVTIDGPAGAGKSATSRALAERLGLEFLNTGAMYRAVALRALRDGIELTDESALAEVARNVTLESQSGRTIMDGEDVTDAVRAPEISRIVRYPANAPSVRAILVEQQRRIGLARPLVTEGRDQGTAVFPDARCKIYLDASPEERARRRLGELRARGEETPLELILNQILERDRLDSEREVGPLCVPQDALRINSDGKSIEQVVDEMERAARSRLAIFALRSQNQ